MLCAFERGASRLENLRVIRCSLFLSECKDLFFVRYFVERKKLLLLLLLYFHGTTTVCLNLHQKHKKELNFHRNFYAYALQVSKSVLTDDNEPLCAQF